MKKLTSLFLSLSLSLAVSAFTALPQTTSAAESAPMPPAVTEPVGPQTPDKPVNSEQPEEPGIQPQMEEAPELDKTEH